MGRGGGMYVLLLITMLPFLYRNDGHLHHLPATFCERRLGPFSPSCKLHVLPDVLTLLHPTDT